jgi:Uma2 family endonuclease
MGLAQRDRDYHTYADYLIWPEEVRYELIDGTAYLIAPAPALDHQEIAGEIFFQLRRALEGKPCRAFVAPVDVRLPKADESDERVDTVVQPDVLVVCDPAKLDRRGVRGAPDFVVEVLSPATAGHDHLLKRRTYERAGVREYWLVHPSDRLLTVYHRVNDRFGESDIQELIGTTLVRALPGVEIAWDELVSRLSPPE